MPNEVTIASQVASLEPDEVEDQLVNLLTRQMADPSTAFFPPLLPVELAMRAVGSMTATPREICEAHGVDQARFKALAGHPVFIKSYQEALEMLKVEGMSFKTKARMQAEDYLATAFAMVKNPNISESVRADLIKSTVRWAGYDAKAVDPGQGGSGFNIQINLN